MYAYYLSGSYSYWFTTEKVVVGQDIYGYEPFRVCGKVVSVTDTNITIHDDIVNSDRTVTRYTNGDSLRSIYSDTDFVLNTSNTTFRLPVKVKLASGNAVCGNGMTLGLTDGTNNAALTQATYLQTTTGSYGEPVGGTKGAGVIADGKILGITTDPTKSGIIADLKNATTETIPCKWFIQVATGVEETVDVTREIELNNPFSLLDYKWSEYELNNASWLLSNGAFHSGTVYKSVYELLLKIHNGTETKDGVSVKLSTEAYEDTDFVINTADTTFRLPIKVKLASGNAVVGNGMTLGLQQGTKNAGAMVTGAGLDYRDDIYGTPTNTASYGATNFQTASIGVTTDPTESGIETSSSGLKLYFYVGETIQDANVINASGVLTRVAELSDEYIVGLGMPDYSAGIDITNYIFNAIEYIAPTDGIVVGTLNPNQSSPIITINDVPFWDGLEEVSPIFGIMSKGDVLKAPSAKYDSLHNDVRFVPFKGAK
jgi:hypothetical protein